MAYKANGAASGNYQIFVLARGKEFAFLHVPSLRVWFQRSRGANSNCTTTGYWVSLTE